MNDGTSDVARDGDAPGEQTPPPGGMRRRMFNRLVAWTERHRLLRRLEILFTAAAIASGIATYVVMTGESGLTGPDPSTVLLLLNVDIVVLLALAALVARRIVKLWVQRRRGGAGSRLHVRLVLLFSLVSVTPAILVAVFSALFFDVGLQSWFSDRVRTALQESVAVAKAYVQEHQQIITGDVLAMANDINRSMSRVVGPGALNRLISQQAAVRGLTEAVIFDESGQVVGRSGYTFALEFETVPMWALERANQGGVAVLTSEADDRVRALVRLDDLAGLYLYVGRFVDPTVIAHMDRTQTAVSQYEMLEGRRSGLQVTFTLVFVVVSLLLLMAAVWFGLSMATHMAEPIIALIGAAERVREGDLTARVAEGADNDEISSLSRAFNRMTSQISAQQSALLGANRELDERRRFTETVLAGVSAGVVGLGPDGRITLPNRSASELLETDLDAALGRPITDVVPEFAAMMDDLRKRGGRQAQGEVSLVRGGRQRIFLVRMAPESLDSEVIGYVVTFDDITELQSAQRTAAWADVARRIAHEIKNPLTPIQLSAERLKRKYLKEISSDAQTFESCTDTIVRQVGDIRRMVNEFSEFARMPAPEMGSHDLTALIRDAVFLQHNAYPGISFTANLPDEPVPVRCDQRQVGQVLTNVLKNAVEAIEGRDGAQAPDGAVDVGLALDGDIVRIELTDNGKGLPKAERDRLTEPYVTTRSKGTGLGLAIVKKIMEDHGGTITLDDAPTGGARVVLTFPAGGDEPAATKGAEA